MPSIGLMRSLCPRAPRIYRFQPECSGPPLWLFAAETALRRRLSIPAPGAALWSHPCGAIPSAQVLSSIPGPANLVKSFVAARRQRGL